MMTRHDGEKSLLPRFWAEIGGGGFTLVITLFTAILPDWIEEASGWSPDAGDGSAEWLIVASLLAVSLVLFVLAATEWRRGPAKESWFDEMLREKRSVNPAVWRR